MADQPGSVQRSFRLSARTSDLLDECAARTGEPRNALVERLLAESLRCHRHPLIAFRSSAADRREPGIVGTRLLVRQVVAQIRDAGGDIASVADYLEHPAAYIQAAVDYYVDHADEIEADEQRAQRIEADERARWERQQAAFA
jgi:uncharacterized protein (DUF433 family)